MKVVGPKSIGHNPQKNEDQVGFLFLWYLYMYFLLVNHQQKSPGS